MGCSGLMALTSSTETQHGREQKLEEQRGVRSPIQSTQQPTHPGGVLSLGRWMGLEAGGVVRRDGSERS